MRIAPDEFCSGCGRRTPENAPAGNAVRKAGRERESPGAHPLAVSGRGYDHQGVSGLFLQAPDGSGALCCFTSIFIHPGARSARCPGAGLLSLRRASSGTQGHEPEQSCSFFQYFLMMPDQALRGPESVLLCAFSFMGSDPHGIRPSAGCGCHARE